MEKRYIAIFLLLLVPIYAQVSSEIYTRYYDILQPGLSSVYVEDPDISFRKIDMDIASTAYNVRFYFNSFGSNPSNLPSIADVYEYVNVLVTNLDNSLVRSAIIEFKVSKAWLSSQSFSDIELHALQDGIWSKVVAEPIGEDSLNYYYQTTQAPFGYFAITGVKGAAPVIPEPVKPEPEVVIVQTPVEAVPEIPVAEEPTSTEEEPVPIIQEEHVQEKKTLFIPFLFAALLLSLLIGVGVTFRKEIREMLFPKNVADVQVLQDVSEKKILVLVDKTEIRNLHDMLWALENISEETFRQHVTSDKNDFSRWVKNELGDPALSGALDSKNRQEMVAIVQEKVATMDIHLKKKYFVTKHNLDATQYESTMHLVHVWKNEGLPIVEMQKRLKLRKLSQEAVDDMLYGTPDDAEDFLIHPDDEAAVNIYLFDALTQGVSIEDVRRKLLEEGWPRVVVEKKLRERFKK